MVENRLPPIIYSNKPPDIKLVHQLAKYLLNKASNQKLTLKQ